MTIFLCYSVTRVIKPYHLYYCLPYQKAKINALFVLMPYNRKHKGAANRVLTFVAAPFIDYLPAATSVTLLSANAVSLAFATCTPIP